MPDYRAAVAALLAVASLLTIPAPPAKGALADDPWVLSTTDPAAAAAAPAYVGNGYVGTRVPADGAGYAAAPVPTQTHVAGVYAAVPDRVHGGAQPEGSVSLPGWTQLDVDVAGERYAAAQATSYRQALDLRRGVVSTTATWSAGGRVTDLTYDVTLDRSRQRVGLVRLRMTPRWSGTVTVRDLLGAGADLSLRPVAAQEDPRIAAPASRSPSPRA
jgi:trehalose/maltose hydrolase-like predicted phosphorylase